MGIHAYLAAFAAFYFSFIPFLYVLNWLGLDKSRFFIGLLLLCFIFGTLEVEGYQNTNTYLGFLVLLVVGFYPRRSPLLRIAAAVLMALTLFFMVLVGARASMVAVVLVLCFWFLSSVRTMRGPHKLLIALVIVTAAVALAVFTDFGALTIFQGRR